MEEMKKMEKLLRDYGYPEKAIPRFSERNKFNEL
jgi:hypothetical protein